MSFTQTLNKPVETVAKQTLLQILVADDNEINRFIMNKMFAHLGYTIELANNGKEAVEKAKQRKFDFIFTDIQMPEMNGYEAAGQILQNASIENIPAPVIIAITASAMGEDKDECLRAGMHDYITKPVDMNQLKSILKKWSSFNKG